MTFDPNRTIARMRRRVVPDWRSRLRDYSTWGISIALLCEMILPIWADVIPHEVSATITKVALTFAAVGKFIRQERP